MAFRLSAYRKKALQERRKMMESMRSNPPAHRPECPNCHPPKAVSGRAIHRSAPEQCPQLPTESVGVDPFQIGETLEVLTKDGTKWYGTNCTTMMRMVC